MRKKTARVWTRSLHGPNTVDPIPAGEGMNQETNRIGQKETALSYRTSSEPAVEHQQRRPSCRELVARACALRPLLTDHCAEGELQRRLPEPVSDALTDAGLFRLLTPARFGGYACDLRTMLKVTQTLGETDGSASWVVAVGATTAWAVSQIGSIQ